MSSIQTVKRLVVFELKHSIWHLLLLFGLSISLLLLNIIGLDAVTIDHLVEGFPSFSTILLYIVLIIIVRPTMFRTQNLAYNFRVCEHLVHLQQLPLKKSIIVTYRLVINYIILIPLLTIYLATMYIIISPLRELLSFNNFVVFALIWLMIGVIILNIQVITDFGTNILFSYIYLFTIFLPIIIAAIAIFNIVIKKNLFELMVYLSTYFPMQSLVVCVVLIILSTSISYQWSLKRMKKIDYLL